MGSLSWVHWVLVLAVGLLLFGGRGKISDLMGDFAKGIKAFKKGLSDEDKPEADAIKSDQMKTIDQNAPNAPGASMASGASAERKA
jgi:sec-independent protein translocase protein TatA